MSPERLRKECQQLTNRVKFLESQLEDAKIQLDSANSEVERHKNEAQKMETHSGRLESGLKDVQEMVSLEKQRLVARAEAAETRANVLAEQVAQLRNLLEEKTGEFEKLRFESVQVIIIISAYHLVRFSWKEILRLRSRFSSSNLLMLPVELLVLMKE